MGTVAVRLLRSERGAAYVMAVITLLAGLILGQALLRLSGAGMAGESSRNDKDAAADMAEAGIACAQMLLADRFTLLPYSSDVSLTYGGFHIDMVDDSARMKRSVLVTSRGTYRGRQQTIRRCVVDDKGPLPYFWALASERSITEADAIISRVKGGVRSNGSVTLTNLFNNITWGVWSGGLITGLGTLTPVYAFSRTIDFPPVKLPYYQSVASFTYPGSMGFAGELSTGSPMVIYVNDKTTIGELTYYGVITIVSCEPVTITGSITRGNASSRLAIVSPKRVEISRSADAIIYTGDVLKVKSSLTINGFAGCKELQTDAGPVTFNLDAGLTPAVMRQMRLPGTLPQMEGP